MADVIEEGRGAGRALCGGSEDAVDLPRYSAEWDGREAARKGQEGPAHI